MRLIIAAIGKTRPGADTDLFNDYLKRAGQMGGQLGLRGPDMVEHEPPRGLRGKARQQKESEMLLAASEGATRIILDEKGKNISSADFAAMISKERDEGAAKMAFLIGGADGHTHELRARADFKLAFGAATWPHMLVRPMLAEQIYRAMTILSGHPYHRS